MRIALSSYRSKPHSGGQGIYVRHLSRELSALGHDVTVFSGQPYPDLDDGVALAKLPSLDLYSDENPFRHPHPRELRDRVDVAEYAGMLSGTFPEPRTFGLRLEREISSRATDFDVIHDNQTLAPALLRLARTTPVVTTIHHPISADRRLEIAAASTPWQKYTKWRWYSFVPMQARVARASRRIITVSDTSREDIVREFRVDPARVSVIPVGVDVDTFTPATSESPRQTGQLTTITSANVPLKGLSVLLDALPLLPDDAWSELVVVGTPNAAVEDQLDALGLTDRVRFVSGISDADLAALIASADIHVVPSLYEGFSLPAVEAMACGTPLVATRVGALPQLVHGDGGADGSTNAYREHREHREHRDDLGSSDDLPRVHPDGSSDDLPRVHPDGPSAVHPRDAAADAGLLVEPGDPRALAEGITDLLARPDLRASMGRVGRRRAESTYSWRAVAEATVAVYEQEITRC